MIVPFGERTPKQELRLPHPKSRSTATTEPVFPRNCWARPRARLAVITVFPTPPLPLRWRWCDTSKVALSPLMTQSSVQAMRKRGYASTQAEHSTIGQPNRENLLCSRYDVAIIPASIYNAFHERILIGVTAMKEGKDQRIRALKDHLRSLSDRKVPPLETFSWGKSFVWTKVET